MTVLRELSEEIGTAGDRAASDNLEYLGLTRETHTWRYTGNILRNAHVAD